MCYSLWFVLYAEAVACILKPLRRLRATEAVTVFLRLGSSQFQVGSRTERDSILLRLALNAMRGVNAETHDWNDLKKVSW